MANLNLLTLSLNDAFKGKIKFEQKGNATQSYFWRVEIRGDKFLVTAQNNGVNQDDYILTSNAKNLEDILVAIEKDQ